MWRRLPESWLRVCLDHRKCTGSESRLRAIASPSMLRGGLRSVQRLAPGAAGARGASATQRPPQVVGETLELTCSRLGTGGKGVCSPADPSGGAHASPLVVLCSGALPGERLVAEVTKVGPGLTGCSWRPGRTHACRRGQRVSACELITWGRRCSLRT